MKSCHGVQTTRLVLEIILISNYESVQTSRSFTVKMRQYCTGTEKLPAWQVPLTDAPISVLRVDLQESLFCCDSLLLQASGQSACTQKLMNFLPCNMQQTQSGWYQLYLEYSQRLNEQQYHTSKYFNWSFSAKGC